MIEQKFDKESLQQFGKKSCIGFFIFGIIALFISLLTKKDNSHIALISWYLAILFGLLTLIWPKSMKYIHYALMPLVFVVSWIMPKVILGILFYLVVTPIGFIMRLSGKDPLNRKIDKNADSYWLAKEAKEHGKKHFEKQF